MVSETGYGSLKFSRSQWVNYGNGVPTLSASKLIQYVDNINLSAGLISLVPNWRAGFGFTAYRRQRNLSIW